MKISNSFFGIKMSSVGMGIQRKKMNLISENLANTNTTRANGTDIPYQRKFLVVRQDNGAPFANNLDIKQGELMQMNTPDSNHFAFTPQPGASVDQTPIGLKSTEYKDDKEGDVVYMPEHPDADQEGYVHMPNVNVVTEMVDMIAATRSYESNLQAFNNSKQMAKDAMEI